VKRFWEWLLKHSGGVVAVFAIVTGLMVVQVSKIQLDTSAEAVNPDNNAIVKLNKEIQKEFNSGKSEFFVLHGDNVFTAGHLNEIRVITEKLKSLTGVLRVTSLSNTTKMIETDGALEISDMAPHDNMSAAEIADIRRYLDANYMMKSGLLAARDGTSTNIVVEFADSVDLPTIAGQMEKEVAETWTGTYDLTGVPTIEAHMLDTIHRDLPLLGGIAFIIILILFAVNYRSFLGVWTPLVQVTIGLAWGAGIFGWMGMKFQPMTVIAPVAILSVGSSFTLHLLGRYFLELSRGIEKRAAIVNVLNQTGLGVFISGLAISTAMLTFLLSDLGMTRGFGLFCALGVGASMLASLTLLPALLYLVPTPKVRIRLENGGVLSAGLKALGRWTGRRPRTVLVIGAVIVVVSVVGTTRIVPNTALVGFFRGSSPVLKGIEAVNKAIGGSTTLTALVDADLQDPETLTRLLTFQEDIHSIPHVGPSTSIASLMRSLHETLTGEPGLPATRDLVAQELLVYQSSGSVDDITRLANLDYSQGIVTIIAPRLSTQETAVLISQLEERAVHLLGNKARLRFAGDIFSETIVERVLIHDFIISITLALFLVICVDSLIRSIRAALVTIIVLASTIVVQYGFLGFTGLPFNLATALAGALAIGVGDYSIHFTVRYMEDRRRGLSPEEAIVMAMSTSGRSIFFTALTIGGGFTALTVSQFMPVATLGGIMVTTVVIVGIATLTLLPAACVLLLRNPVSHMEVMK
jgi:hydrophobe/amphiphile efflux-3 (HAE3) family protein